MQTAIERYLAKKIQADHAALINTHVTALISGENGAPVEERNAALAFIAQSPEHAQAYGLKVLQEALLAGALKAPVPIIVGLGDLVVAKPKAAPEARKASSAKPTPGGAENIRQMAWELHKLLTTYREQLEPLAKENGGAFASQTITRLVSAAQIVEMLGRMDGGPRAQLGYLLDAQELGTIPVGFIRGGIDRLAVHVERPRSTFTGQDEWSAALQRYVGSERFASDVETKPVDPSNFGLHQHVRDLYREFGHSHNLSGLISLFEQHRYAEARAGAIRFRQTMLKQRTDMLAEIGLRQMQNFDVVVRGYLDRGDFRSAEAVLDFVQGWTAQALALSGKITEVSDLLVMAGESRARASFERIANELLAEGDVSGLQRFMGSVRMQVRRLTTVAKAKKGQLSTQVAAALLFILESMRSLGVLQDEGQRALMAAKVPDVESLLTPGAGLNSSEAVRARMKALGIPVPGEEGVPALGTGTVSGLSLEAAEELRALPAPGQTSDGSGS
jgi:hypothetical protein